MPTRPRYVLVLLLSMLGACSRDTWSQWDSVRYVTSPTDPFWVDWFGEGSTHFQYHLHCQDDRRLVADIEFFDVGQGVAAAVSKADPTALELFDSTSCAALGKVSVKGVHTKRATAWFSKGSPPILVTSAAGVEAVRRSPVGLAPVAPAGWRAGSDGMALTDPWSKDGRLLLTFPQGDHERVGLWRVDGGLVELGVVSGRPTEAVLEHSWLPDGGIGFAWCLDPTSFAKRACSRTNLE